MTRISPWVLVLALAVSACGTDAGGGASNGGAGNALAVEAAGNASAGSQAAQAGGAPTSSQRAPIHPSGTATMPLQPLSEEDLASTIQMGCTCQFNSRNRTYVQAIGDELMVRTLAGRQVCPITNAQIQSFGESDNDVPCAGVRVSIRETGARTLDVVADSSEGPATLSASEDGTNGTLDGTWGCAC